MIWYHTHTHTHKQWHTVHTGANRLTYPYKYILTPPVMYSHQLAALHWITFWCQQFTLRSCKIFKNYWLVESHICWLDSIRLSSAHETQISKTHATTHSVKDKIKKG